MCLSHDSGKRGGELEGELGCGGLAPGDRGHGNKGTKSAFAD
jgi:hypothetical protein